MTAKIDREGPLKVDMKFDEAIKRALKVKPPPEGWQEYEKKLQQQRSKKKAREKIDGLDCGLLSISLEPYYLC